MTVKPYTQVHEPDLRPTIYPRIRLSRDELADLTAAATRQDMSVSEFIAHLIRKELSQ